MSDDLIIFPDPIPKVPEEVFKVLEYLKESEQAKLGLKDIVGLNGKSYRTATRACREQIDTMDKISDQIKKRMGNVYS